MKRLTDLSPALERYYAALAPLVEAERLGPVIWQLPERFHRDLPCLRAVAALFELGFERGATGEVGGSNMA